MDNFILALLCLTGAFLLLAYVFMIDKHGKLRFKFKSWLTKRKERKEKEYEKQYWKFVNGYDKLGADRSETYYILKGLRTLRELKRKNNELYKNLKKYDLLDEKDSNKTSHGDKPVASDNSSDNQVL